MNEYNGEFPKELEVLINRLPGVGRYTAGAVSSIAFNQVLFFSKINSFKSNDLFYSLGKSNS